MLIQCPECGKQISDKANQCIHCGYPMKEIKTQSNEHNKTISSYDVKLTDTGKQKIYLLQVVRTVNDGMSLSDAVKITDNLSTIKSNITLEEANKIKSAIEKVGGKVSITKADSNAVEYNTDQHRVSLNVPYCPKCGSTSITTGARGVDGFWGFFGASRTVNRCANCGHSWEPRG